MPEENQPEKEHRSSLQSLEERLYSRTPPPLRHDEEFIGEEKHVRIAPGWTSDAERKESSVYSMISTLMPWLKRFFVASILFFFFAAALALLGFWRGSNTVSPENISVDVQGPVGAGAGEELMLTITIGNGNALDLDSVDLLVEFPDGTRKPEDLSEPLLRYRDALGALSAGESASREITLIPFGEEGEEKKIKVTAEYRPKDSNAIFSRKQEFAFTINSAPVTMDLGIPKEVSSDQVFEAVIELSSNSAVVQNDLLLKAQYPFGFQFQESTPAPSFGKDTWLIGDLPPQGKRTVRIKGKLIATEQAERTFRFSVGTQSSKDEKQLGTTFLSESPSISIQRPFMKLDLLVNGEEGKTFVARSGQTVRVDIPWGNNLTTKIANLEITAELTGSIYNSSSVSSPDGSYDSATDRIVWNQGKNGRFAAVEPSEDGSVSFNFVLLPVATTPALFKNPTMTIKVTAHAKRLDEQGLYQDVTASAQKEIKIATTLSLTSKLLHTDGAFDNTGFVPPKAENATTYTVVWSLSNTSSGIAGTKVSAVLPSYVTFLNTVSPSGEKVSYNPVGGEVVWDVGEVTAGVGVGTAPREVSFKVSLKPSLNQVGTSPTVIGDTTAKATDRFTGTEVKSNVRPAITTGGLSDVGASSQSGVVTR